MYKYLAILALITFISIQSSSQEKKMWADSYLNQKAPELIVEEWISDKPETEGKFVLIDFWATWCPPCRRAIPDLNEYQNIFANDLVVIGISDENPDKVRNFNNPLIEYYSAVDTQKRTKTTVNVQGIPHVMIIDPDGIVRWEGFPALSGHELTEDIINKIIGKYSDR